MSLASDTAAANAKPQAFHQTRRMLFLWLGLLGVLLVGIIVLGGTTRLTQSGLSITEWRPVTGIVPPLSEAVWEAEFQKYQRIPQYAALFPAMTLAEFKTIYWWEWSHRMLGRIVGLVALLPLVFFVATRRIGPRLTRRLVFILLLIAAQGALGWYMVQSGLSARIAVSPYRLAAHLGLAFLIYGAVLGTLFDLGLAQPSRKQQPSALYFAALSFVVLVFAQIFMGAFMAGTHAGLANNTWPLIDGRFVPKGLFVLKPWSRNLFENVTTIHFIHRMLAYLILICAIALWLRARRSMRVPVIFHATNALVATAALQTALGVAALLAVVPVSLALLHQLGAIAVFSAALYNLKVAGLRAQRASSA